MFFVFTIYGIDSSMHLENLDLNLLVAIDAMIRNKSVTAAAAELNLTQSAVSSALNRARQHYADEILYYDGRHMVPTPFGRELEAIVPDMIASLRGLSRMRASTDLSSMERQFSVIASDYVSVVFLAGMTRKLAQVAPKVSLLVVPFTQDAMRQFNRHKLDFLIGPPFAMEKGLLAEPLFEDEFKCVLSRDNPIAEQGFTREAYFSSPHVVTNFFLNNGKSHFERWLDTEAPPVTVAAALPSFVVLPYFIAGTRNVATVHKRLLPYFDSKPDLVYLDPPLPIPRLQEQLVTKGQLTHDSEALLMRKFMLDYGKSMQGATSDPSGFADTAPR